MANKTLKRYGLESAARILIATGVLLVLFSWIAGTYYYGSTGSVASLIVPFVFTCVLALLLLVIRYRYTLFEEYPYLMNLPSLFYRIRDKDGTNNQSLAFSMIFTVHALAVAFLGLLSLVLTISIGFSIKRSSASPLLYVYLVIITVLVVSVLLQYRRIYIRFSK